jgi:hypothetical protein
MVCRLHEEEAALRQRQLDSLPANALIDVLSVGKLESELRPSNGSGLEKRGKAKLTQGRFNLAPCASNELQRATGKLLPVIRKIAPPRGCAVPSETMLPARSLKARSPERATRGTSSSSTASAPTERFSGTMSTKQKSSAVNSAAAAAAMTTNAGLAGDSSACLLASQHRVHVDSEGDAASTREPAGGPFAPKNRARSALKWSRHETDRAAPLASGHRVRATTLECHAARQSQLAAGVAHAAGVADGFLAPPLGEHTREFPYCRIGLGRLALLYASKYRPIQGSRFAFPPLGLAEMLPRLQRPRSGGRSAAWLSLQVQPPLGQRLPHYSFRLRP